MELGTLAARHDPAAHGRRDEAAPSGSPIGFAPCGQSRQRPAVDFPPLSSLKRGAGGGPTASGVMGTARIAKFSIGQVVRHRLFPFRGVVFDVDPVFDNTEEWWLAIPEDMRPAKDQPFYHLFAENAESEYIAYVSEQNLVPDESDEPLRHPQIKEFFRARKGDLYVARDRNRELN
jgi:heat shock protein HspQ